MTNDFSSSAIVPNRLNRTTAHRLITKRLLIISLRLLVNKRVAILIRAHEVIGRGVAADVAIDARRIHVIRTANVLFYFFAFVRHAESGRQGCVISCAMTH